MGRGGDGGAEGDDDDDEEDDGDILGRVMTTRKTMTR